MSNFISNSNILRVSEGMMRMVDVLDGYTHSEKQCIIASVFNCVYNSKLRETYSVSDVMEMVDTMRWECKRQQIPEFGGSERYIQGEC